MKSALLFAAAVLALALVAPAAGAGRGAKFVYFRMPSKNIACAYMAGYGGPTSLRCDIFSKLKPKPHGICLEGVWSAVYLTKTGKGRAICISDTVYNAKAPFLAYGKTWRYDGFTCVSETTGLTCSNRYGHGFFLSRERYRVH